MKKLMICSGCLLAMAATAGAAVQGPVHGLKAAVQYDRVALSWNAPSDAKELKWHDGSIYNGETSGMLDPQKPVSFYVAAEWSAEDLASYVGDGIKAVKFGQYYEPVSVDVQVLADGAALPLKETGRTEFQKGAFCTVSFEQGLAIEAGKTYRVVLHITGGHNNEYLITMDSRSDAPGKGDLFSLDGKTWKASGKGDYSISLVLDNPTDAVATGYSVRENGKDLLTGITTTSATLENQATGTHTYEVVALYADGEQGGATVTADCRSFATAAPAVNIKGASVSGFNVALDWHAPFSGTQDLTWASGTLGASIGGTASSNAKVWVRNLFDANDLVKAAGASITSLELMVADACITGATAWIQRDGEFVYSRALTDEEISAIKANEWLQAAVTEPVAVEPGHTYAYGFYVLHTAKKKPLAADNTEAVVGKGNAFSTSSASSTFSKSKPTWKNLSDGNIAGNWMMRANLDRTSAAPAASYTYTVARDGQAVATDIAATWVEDIVPSPGTYTYAITAKDGNGNQSIAVQRSVKVALPEIYAGPTLTTAEYNDSTATVSMGWSADRTLALHGDPTYYLGFDEDMDMMWGAQLSKEVLAPYAGMSLKALKFCIFEPFGDFSVGVYTAKGRQLAVIDCKQEEIEGLVYYTATLSNPVAITGEEDLVLAYSGKIPAGKNAILVDGGPLVDGGARVSFTSGATWMNLGTVNATYNDVNVIISAIVGEADAAANATDLELKSNGSAEPVFRLNSDAAPVRQPELDANVVAAGAPKAKAAAMPRAKYYRVYRNGAVAEETEGYAFSEKLASYGQFSYYVTAVYEIAGGEFESAPSRTVSLARNVAQRSRAPHGLYASGESSNFKLHWNAPDNAPVLGYLSPDAKIGALGLTASGNVLETHLAVRFPADTLSRYTVADPVSGVEGATITRLIFAIVGHVHSLAAEITIGDNIVYTQDVPVLSTEETTGAIIYEVTLNEPFVVPAGAEVGVGYKVTYDKGGKPLGVSMSDAAIPGVSDLISQKGSMGYWYSLKTKYKLDYTNYIQAVLGMPDNNTDRKKAAGAAYTYNVYRDGQMVQTGLTETSAAIPFLDGCTYTVTAVNASGAESGHSNKFFNISAGVDNILTDSGADANAPAEYFDLQGRRVFNPAPGTMLLKRQGATVTKMVIK